MGAVALEDSIMKKGSPAAAGSKMLENFIAPFNAAVVERLNDANIVIAGQAHMPEFGIPGIERQNELLGGVKAVRDNSAEFCLCNDLFGSYRRQAAENGLCYIHPTYGTVSRFGLIPLASSMDQIGVLCKNVADGFSLLSVIAGHDKNDGAMLPEKNYCYKNEGKDITINVPSNVIRYESFSKKFNVADDPLEYFDAYKQTMYVLSCAEISNNISRYDGIKFGCRSENAASLESLYTKTRTEAFGIETKLTAVMGAFVLAAGQYVPYYEKAMKIRRLIKESLRFDKYDVIALPASAGGSPYDNLALYALTALAGLPSINYGGIQLIADAKNENALLTAWEVLRS